MTLQRLTSRGALCAALPDCTATDSTTDSTTDCIMKRRTLWRLRMRDFAAIGKEREL